MLFFFSHRFPDVFYHAYPILHHHTTFSFSSEIVPFNPISNTSILHSILESLFLTMTLKQHHIHPISGILFPQLRPC